MKYITFPGCTPSFAENKIITKMQAQGVHFEREVSFDGLINPSTAAPLRYDFYVPAFNTIIEYDGIESHSASDVKERDAIKNKFATDHRIRLFRISGIRNIDAFFNSDVWKRMIKRAIIHKPKPKKITTWANIYQPKEDIAPEEKKVKTQAEIKMIMQMRHNRAPKECDANPVYDAAFAVVSKKMGVKKFNTKQFRKAMAHEIANQRYIDNKFGNVRKTG